ncbi:hypothetical protein HGA88_05515 [Candidatus Roizmanbacteria bacterium]|nr:hypothetical protein [Candidatus Roizmanbacteria bacterium]
MERKQFIKALPLIVGGVGLGYESLHNEREPVRRKGFGEYYFWWDYDHSKPLSERINVPTFKQESDNKTNYLFKEWGGLYPRFIATSSVSELIKQFPPDLIKTILQNQVVIGLWDITVSKQDLMRMAVLQNGEGLAGLSIGTVSGVESIYRALSGSETSRPKRRGFLKIGTGLIAGWLAVPSLRNFATGLENSFVRKTANDIGNVAVGLHPEYNQILVNFRNKILALKLLSAGEWDVVNTRKHSTFHTIVGAAHKDIQGMLENSTPQEIVKSITDMPEKLLEQILLIQGPTLREGIHNLATTRFVRIREYVKPDRIAACTDQDFEITLGINRALEVALLKKFNLNSS